MEVTVFTYPPEGQPTSRVWEGLHEVSGESHEERSAHLQSRSPGAERMQPGSTSEELRRSFEAGREHGHREGLLAEQAQHNEARTAAERERIKQITAQVEQFYEERDRYLHAVEHEVVELALAIAARILRREAQMDPLLLTGAARVALGQLSESTEVRLHVPAGDFDLWREAITHLPNLAVRPEVVAKTEMRLGDCVLETQLGSVDLGVRAQLGEIERGFFDRTGRGTPGKTTGQGMDVPDEALR
jgi:flagellar assembly protein FliH